MSAGLAISTPLVRSLLRIHCRRFHCCQCKRHFVQPLPGLLPGRRSTEPFRSRIFEQHHEGIPASSMARIERIGAATVSRIYGQFTQRKAGTYPFFCVWVAMLLLGFMPQLAEA